MSKLSVLEEMNVFGRFVTPYMNHMGDVSAERKTAYEVLLRNADDILLIDGTEFAFGRTIAGLTEAMAEILLKRGGKSQREGLSDFLSDEEAFHEAMKTAEDMDDDEEGRSTKHRERVTRVIWYLRDNSVVLG